MWEPLNRVRTSGCKRGDNSKKDPDMTNFRICGLVVAAATLLLASMA